MDSSPNFIDNELDEFIDSWDEEEEEIQADQTLKDIEDMKRVFEDIQQRRFEKYNMFASHEIGAINNF